MLDMEIRLKSSVGIIGGGYVGKATHNSLTDCEVSIYDPKFPAFSNREILLKTDVCFICVPTPTVEGAQDAKIILETLHWLDVNNYSGLIIIKSTLMPNIMRDVLVLFDKLNIMAAPEFLDQATYLAPYNKHLIGVTNIYQYHIYKKLYPNSEVMVTDPITAFTSKYTHNTHGALKVTFFNEIYDVCKRIGVSYREMMNCVLFVNNNVGAQYTRIAADGERGFGGACMGKDIIAFNNLYNLKTLEAAIEKNLDYRHKYMEDML